MSNHEELRGITEWYRIPYHYLPLNEHNKAEQEDEMLRIIGDQKVDLLALARYMQILSAEMCETMAGKSLALYGFVIASGYLRTHLDESSRLINKLLAVVLLLIGLNQLWRVFTG